MVNSNQNISVVILSVCELNVLEKIQIYADYNRKYLKYMIQKDWKLKKKKKRCSMKTVTKRKLC